MSDRPRDPAITPDAFRRARAIFESALDWPPAERDRLIRDACGADAALAADVERMLRADAVPHPLLDRPALPHTDRWQPGDLVAGHYRVIALIGRGGMGEVYRAHDATLGREVALKVLPARAGGTEWGDDRFARVRREAQVLAGLNHSNIAAIYGLESVEDAHALVLELVEGPTLADRIAAGAVPLDETLGIARQIAVGLEAAHELGVVHRDLKPANIKVRPDGTVKILDFGLAKVVQPAVAGDATTASPAITSPSMVAGGVILGTAAYMSPEQAKGREADRRSDIWAFGAVLYELLSGERTFKGADIADTLAAVLRVDVDWTRLPPSTPASIRQLLVRCLERDPLRRLRDIGEARILLEDVFQKTPHATTPNVERSVRPSPRWRHLVVPIVTAIVTGAAVAVALWPRERATNPQVTRFALSMPTERALILDPQSIDLGLAPDGSRVIYKGGPRADRSQLFVYALDQLEPKPLTSVGLPKGPVVSPDGQWVMFVEPGLGGPGPVVKKVSINGGPPLQISRLDGPGRGVTWGDDDSIIAASGAPATGLLRISPSGGEPMVLTRPNRDRGESDHWFPVSLPGSRSILFTVTSLTGGLNAASVAVLDVASGTWKTLIRNASQARYLPSGHLVYVSGGALWAVAFDLKRLEPFGTPAVVVPEVVTLPTGVAEFDIARDGTLAYVSRGGAGPRTLVWVDRAGREEPIAAPPRPYSRVRVSPDGTRIALEIDDEDQDIFVWHVSRQTLTRVTTDPGLDESPEWTADGQRLIFTSQAGGVLGSLFSQAADGTGAAERLTEGRFIQRPTAVLPDGRHLVFSESDALKLLALDQSRAVRTLVDRTPGDGAVSPDGRWLAYAGVDSGSPQVYVSPFTNPETGRTQVSVSGGNQPRWAPNGRDLFFTGLDGTLMRVTVAAGPTFTPSAPTRVLERVYFNGFGLLSREGSFDVAPDGRFLMLKPADTPGRPAEPPTVIVVKNWMEDVKRLVPAHR
jgi:serine/threonine-protein kinase